MDDIIQAVAGLRRDDLIRQAQCRQRARTAQHRPDSRTAARRAAGLLSHCRRWDQGQMPARRMHT
jgi:hypothetical protein